MTQTHTTVRRLLETPRHDLRDIPLDTGSLVFVDGCVKHDQKGGMEVGYAVVTAEMTLESGALPQHWSAQKAELHALTRACELHKGQEVTIYTDSRYAFGVVHDFGTLWQQRNFLTAMGKHISNRFRGC